MWGLKLDGDLIYICMSVAEGETDTHICTYYLLSISGIGTDMVPV